MKIRVTNKGTFVPKAKEEREKALDLLFGLSEITECFGKEPEERLKRAASAASELRYRCEKIIALAGPQTAKLADGILSAAGMTREKVRVVGESLDPEEYIEMLSRGDGKMGILRGDANGSPWSDLALSILLSEGFDGKAYMDGVRTVVADTGWDRDLDLFAANAASADLVVFKVWDKRFEGLALWAADTFTLAGVEARALFMPGDRNVLDALKDRHGQGLYQVQILSSDNNGDIMLPHMSGEGGEHPGAAGGNLRYECDVPGEYVVKAALEDMSCIDEGIVREKAEGSMNRLKKIVAGASYAGTVLEMDGADPVSVGEFCAYIQMSAFITKHFCE